MIPPTTLFANELYALTDKCNTFLTGFLPQSPLLFVADKEAPNEEELDGLPIGHYIDPKTGNVIPYAILGIERKDKSILCYGFCNGVGSCDFALDYVRADQLPLLCDFVNAAI